MARQALRLVIEICQKSVSSKLDIFKILLWFILVIAYFVVGPGTLTEAWIQFCRQFVLPAIFFVTFILFVRSKWGLLLTGHLSPHERGSIALYKKDIKIKEKLVKKHPGQPEHAIALAEAYRNFGAALQNQGKNAKANSLYAKAVHLERKQAAVPRQFHKF
mgnify:CR=1 FL=1